MEICFLKGSKRISCEDQKARLSELLQEMEHVDLLEKNTRADFARKLKLIDVDTIVDEIGMADMPLIMYVLSLKYKGRIGVIPVENDCILKGGNRCVANMSYLAIYIYFVEVRHNCLHVEGNVSQPAIFAERCGFGVENNGVLIPVDLTEANLDLKKGVNVYETRTAYSVDIPLNEDENTICFYNYLDGNKCNYGRINSMRFAPIADCLKNQYCVRDGWIIEIKGNSIRCLHADEEKIQKKEKAYIDSLRASDVPDYEWVKSMREEYHIRKKNKTKPIWLFMDRIDRADDNAEAMFRYVMQKDEVDAYFIIQKDTRDGQRLLSLGNIVDVYSREHLLLVMLADYILSSQVNGVVENPFWEKAEYFRDLYHQPKIIFLQHGITKDDMSCTMNRYYANIHGLITSTRPEAQSFLDYPYGYTEKNIWLTGFPRYDLLYNNPQRYILLMPSWRKGLMEQVWEEEKNAMVWAVKEGFTESEYVKRYSALLQHPKLLDACRQYGYKLAFMPHALMEPYIDQFVQNEECVYWDASKSYRDAFAEGDLMITDYSSVAFDFAYLEKPILYYQFDKERFFAEHTYVQGYFDYERDGFGEVVYDENLLVDFIIEYMANECSVKDLYRDRIRNTFAYRDKNSCERVYKYLTEE